VVPVSAVFVSVPVGTVPAVVLGSFAALFGVFGLRTVLRHGTSLEMTDTELRADGAWRRRIPWAELDRLKLAYYSTSRDRRSGWMQLEIGAGRARVKLDSRIDGFDRLIGKGIYYGAARSEASATHGLDVHLIGAGNSAGQAALHFANHARRVTLVIRGDSLEKSMSYYLIEQLRGKSNIAVQLRSEIQAVYGDSHLTEIEIRNSANKSVHRQSCGGLFVFIGADADTGWLPAEIARDARGYVLTGDDVVKAGHWSHSRDPYLLEASVPGIFACGDVRLSPVKRVASAVGEGSMAIALVHQYLQQDAQPRRSPI
jgi:thioredoxin reductase